MPPRLLISSARSLVFRTRPVVPQKRLAPAVQQHFASDDATKKPGTPEPKGPNLGQAPHVSEEQAAIDKTMGKTPPDMTQGTPVQEILERDAEGKAKAPEIMKQDMDSSNPSGPANSTPSGTRTFSTSARRRDMEMQTTSVDASMPVSLQYPDAGLGHKYALPDINLMSRHDNLKRRYDPVVDQVTKSIMRHGKLAQAQTNMSIILDTLRTAPAPQLNLQHPDRILIGSIPREALPLYPVAYLTAAIDSVAPLIKIRQQRGMLGGGAVQPIPQPLRIRQRRRQAIQWILTAADNRKEVRLADRVAREIINVAEGKSGVWDRRHLLHRMAIAARSNVRLGPVGPRSMSNRRGL